MADPITAMLVIGAAAEVGSAVSEVSAANSKMDALDLTQKQNTIEYQQKVLSNLDITEKVLATQQAESTMRGFTMNSPSFEAIQRNTINTSAKENKNLALEESILDENVRKEKANVRATLFSKLFGNVTNFALGAASVKSKMPTKSKVV